MFTFFFNATLYFPKKYIVVVANGTKMLEGIEIKESFATTWFKIARVIKRLRFMRFLMRGNGVCVCVCVCVCVSVCLFCFGIFYPVLWLIFLLSLIIEYDIKIMSYQLKNFWSEKNKN